MARKSRTYDSVPSRTAPHLADVIKQLPKHLFVNAVTKAGLPTENARDLIRAYEEC